MKRSSRNQKLSDKLDRLAKKNLSAERQRQELLKCLKTHHKKGWQEAQQKLESQHLQGSKCAEILCKIQDEILQNTCRFVADYMFDGQAQIAVVAIGGYGRGRLAPYSDLDLLFLRDAKPQAADTQFIETVLYILWDMGLKVGHAVRDIAESIKFAKDDMTIRTSLLEARFLWGERPLYDNFREQFLKFTTRTSVRPFVAAKLAERDARHDKAGRSRYLVEPNVKEGKGGLRDLNTLFWIAKYCYQLEDLDGLVAQGLLCKEELSLFRRCYNFLWAVRCHLHFLTGRAEERLGFNVQKELALRMGVKAASGLNPVEKFMRRYFLVAKDVGDLTAIFCAILEEQQNKKMPRPRLPKIFQRQKTSAAIGIIGGRLGFKRQDSLQQDPLNIIRIFHLADKYRLDIHPMAAREITRNLSLINADMRADAEANNLFLEILTSKKDPERSLRRMNETGVLGKFIGDFGRIVALMQFNMYHHYTADEHLLRAIGILSEIENGHYEEDHARAYQLLGQGLNRKIIYLAVFLHDIAKGRPEDHSLAGAQIARRLAPRLGFTETETEMVAWLVEYHLIMSDIAQRRDLSDPQTIAHFVSQVQTTERLKYLYVLTVVDIQAVGPGVWNGWKAQLLSTLYEAAEALIHGGGTKKTRHERAEQARQIFAKAAQKHIPKTQIMRFTEDLPSAYWVSMSLEEQLHHAQMLPQLKTQKIILDIDYTGADTDATLNIICEDHPGLFARLTAAVSVARLNILDARIATTRRGVAVDCLRLATINGENFGKEHEEKLRHDIHAILGEDVQRLDLLTKQKPRYEDRTFDLSPQIEFDNELSQQATIIEVSGLDRPGLLHDLAKALFRSNVTIISARLATFGEKAVDVFYVQDLFGSKITNANKRHAITSKLRMVMRGEKADKKKDRVA